MILSIHSGKLLFYVIIATIYAFIYYLYRDELNGLSKRSSFLDCWYFSFTTFSTVGYGDISPKTNIMKVIVLTQQMILLMDFANEFLSLIGIEMKQ